MLKSDQQKYMYGPIAPLLSDTMPVIHERDMVVSDERYLPNTSVLNKGFDSYNDNHKKLQFITQDHDMPYAHMAYEERIFLHGFIATRNNWHDYFNALVWKRFPCIKSALNAIHYQEMTKQSDSMRSRKRDLITLFDECGVIIIAQQPILDMIKQHQWQALFVEHKQHWLTGQIQIITFGHAMFEKYLQPYIGMTAQALLLRSEDMTGDFNNISSVDKKIAKGLMNRHLLNSKADLSPLPILGIPDWYDKQNQQFYDNTQYFRPLRLP